MHTQQNTREGLPVTSSHQENNLNLYDLSTLKKIARGDNVFVQKMLNDFIMQAPEYINKMDCAITNYDMDELYHLSHTFKARVDYLHIVNLKPILRKLEILSCEKPELFKLGNLQLLFAEELNKVVKLMLEKECVQVV